MNFLSSLVSTAQKTKDPDDIQAVLEEVENFIYVNLPPYAKSPEGYKVDLQDYMQACREATVKAVFSFDPDLGHSFTTYLHYRIIDACQIVLRKGGYAVSLPSSKDRLRELRDQGGLKVEPDTSLPERYEPLDLTDLYNQELYRALLKMPEEDRYNVCAAYGVKTPHLTTTERAKRLGVTQQTVSNRVRKSLGILREYYAV